MIDLTTSEMQDEMARARAELAKLGVCLDEPLEDRVYAAVVAWWRSRKTPPSPAAIGVNLGCRRDAVHYALAKLRAEGRLLNPRRGLWVPAAVPEP